MLNWNKREERIYSFTEMIAEFNRMATHLELFKC